MVDISNPTGRSGLVAARIDESVKIAALPVVLALLLAGCAASPDVTVDDDAPATDTMTIRGIVQTSELGRVDANVTVMPLNLTETTAPDGSFAFPPMPLAAYTVTAEAAGYLTRTLDVAPGSNESILITLEAVAATPTVETVRYKGHLQCAAEYLIIAGSCDRFSTQFGGPALVDSAGIFEHPVAADWETIVVDVVFAGGAASTYDGLRVTVKGVDASDALNEYEQYGRFHDSDAFTFRIEPDQAYPDGAMPVPRDATMLLLDVFAQGHGYHEACDPTGAFGCFLGVGAGIDIQFELVVTTFTIERAPDGFSLR